MPQLLLNVNRLLLLLQFVPGKRQMLQLHLLKDLNLDLLLLV